MLLHATFWSFSFFYETYIKSYRLHTKMTNHAWPTECRGESRMQTTSCARPAAESTAHITIGGRQDCGCHNPAVSNIVAATILSSAISWLPQSCPCSKIKARAAILWQPRCCCRQDSGNHNVAAGKIVAENPATMLLPATLWRGNIKTLHR